MPLLQHSMASSSLALRRLVSSSNLLSKSLRPACTASSRRLFNTDAAREHDNIHDSDADVDRRVLSPLAFAEALGNSLNKILKMMEQLESPESGGVRRSWDVREMQDGLHVRVDMPGLSKEDVKVSVKQKTLIIKGKGRKEFEEEEGGRRRYSRGIDLPENLYNTSEIKAEMKNGVLKLLVPKITEEERNGVVRVKIN